ncbi:MAG: spermidine synthase [Planctomycetota bacterium]
MVMLISGLIFFLSGAAGLADEILWFRMLTTVFGASAPALAATTAAFMAGLALGSALASTRRLQPRTAVSVYAVLECLIAGTALLMPLALHTLSGLPDLVATAAEQPGLRAVVRFAAVFLLLLLPTGLMGATVPVISMSTPLLRQATGQGFAWLYGMNTLGAVAGTLVTGFFLLPTLGVTSTLQLAASLNLLAAAFAWLVLRPLLPRTLSLSDVREIKQAQVLIAEETAFTSAPAIAAFTAGFVSLAAQHLWSRTLVFSFDRLKNTTYSVSAVLAVGLSGLAAGALCWTLFPATVSRSRMTRSWLLLLMSLSMAVSVLFLLTLPKLRDEIRPETLQVVFPRAVLQVLLRTTAIIGLPTLLSGLLLPACVQSSTGRPGQEIGRIYALNALGSVLGAALAPFVIVPAWGLYRGLLALSCLTATVSLCLLLPHRLRTILATGCAALIGLLLAPQLPAPDTLLPGEFVVRSIDGPTASVSVIENTRGERRISVDDVPVAGTSLVMQTDQKSLAHWGMLLAGQPRKALTVGFGSGGASASFLLHDQLLSLDCVEISPEVPACADLLTDANHGLLQQTPVDPRYQLILEDARAYLRGVSNVYDVIVSDCTDLRYRSSANLYDREYFELCRRASTETGCTLIWMPLGGLSRSAFLMTLRTFASVFPEMHVYYLNNRWTHYVLLAGRRSPWTFPAERARQMLEEADVRSDLAVIGFTSPYRIASTLITTAPALKDLLRDGPLNTEETPLLEFLVPRADTGPDAAQRNLNLLRARSVSISGFLPRDLASDERDRYSRFSRAARHLLAAQEAERRTDVENAAREYLAASKLTPEDQQLRTALEFPELRKAAENGNPTAFLLLARALQMQTRFTDARTALDQYTSSLTDLRRLPSSPGRQFLPQAEAWEPTAKIWLEEINAAIRRHQNPP